MQTPPEASPRPIAVYGATGYTGRQMARELVRRGSRVTLAGRRSAALAVLAEQLGGDVDVAEVQLNDGAGLADLASHSAVVANCAGPFSETSTPLATAAVAGGADYVDHAAEPPATKRMLEDHDDAARSAGVAVVPSLSFYSAAAVALADVLASPLQPVDEVTVAYAVDGWLMTRAAKATLPYVRSARWTYADGQLVQLTEQPERTAYTFPAGVGEREVIEHYPGCEPLLIPRRLATQSVRTLMTASTFEDPRVFSSEDVGDEERAASRFLVSVTATRDDERRVGWVKGRDIYGIGAWIAAEGALHLAQGPVAGRAGTLTVADVLDARALLEALETSGYVDEVVIGQ